MPRTFQPTASAAQPTPRRLQDSPEEQAQELASTTQNLEEDCKHLSWT